MKSYLCVPTGGDDLKPNVPKSVEHHDGGGLHPDTMVRVLLGRRAGQVELELALKMNILNCGSHLGFSSICSKILPNQLNLN